MKKLFLMFAAVAALFATSCVTDTTTSDVAVTGGECDVTLSVVAPGADSRATIGTGLKATDLTCAVYDHEWKYLTTKTGEFTNGSLSTTIEMRLVKGKTYNFVFWAQAPEATCYTLNFGTTVGEVVTPNVFVNYDTEVNANDDYRDAFFGQELGLEVEGTVIKTIELKRPFAQINFGADDHVVAEEFGFDVIDNPDATTTVTTRAFNTLYLADGAVDNEQDVTFVASALPTDTILTTNKGDYHWLAMNYILWGADEGSLSTCTLTVAASNHSVSVEVPGAPARRNWRTNLVGSLLTEQGNLTIEIKPIPVGDLPDESNPLHQLVVAAYNGGEVTLTEDVVLPTALNVTADMTINLNGHNITIDAAYDSANYEASSAIVNNAILTLTGNGEIKATNNYTVRNNATMVIDGVTVKNGVMNFGDLTVNSGNISNDRSGKHTIYGNAAKLTINGGTFHNGNPGNAGIFAYGGEVVINGGEFTIADGTATLGWTSCLLDAQGGAKYTIYGGLVRGEIRDYNKNTTIYGGTFSHYNSIKGFIAEGYVAKQNSENLWVIYKGAATVEALAEAISNGDEVVVLTEDIATAEAIVIPAGATATIDLNGKTITAATTDGIVANAGATLTISGNGKVESHSAPIRALGGKVVVEGGEFTQTGDYFSTPSTLRYSVDSREGGEIIVKGGTFNTINGMINVSANSSVVIEGGIFNNTIQGAATRHFAYIAGTLTIKGGEFKSVANAGAGGTFFCGAGANGKVIVEGGKFTSLWNNGTKNNIWESYFGGSIEIKGGIFNHNGGINAQVTENTDAATKDAYPYMAK